MTFDVKIKHWHAVASWTWDAGDDVCGICRMPFDGCPPEARFPGDDSPVVWGTCAHAFHLQCINRHWEFKQAAVSDGEQEESIGVDMEDAPS
ncbi:APC11 [Auxenochlorella protothecoides x Auxenochlorella symbiontica]